MNKKLHLVLIDFYFWLEHKKPQSVAIYAYKKRKQLEHRFVAKYKENIYGQPL